MKKKKARMMVPVLLFGMMLGSTAVLPAAFPSAVLADELNPNLKFASVIFEPKNAVYPYTGKAVKPEFKVLMPDPVPTSEYTYDIISKDDPEAGTSAGTVPGIVTIEITGLGDESFGYYGSQRISYRIAKAEGLKAKECKVACNTAEGSFDLNSIILNPSGCGKRTYTLGKLTDEGGLLSEITITDSKLHFSLNHTAGSAEQEITVSTEYYADVNVTITLEAVTITGDCNRDGKFDQADIICLNSWLTGTPDAKPVNWKAADLNADGKLDAVDLTKMMQALKAAKKTASKGEQMETPKNMPEIVDTEGAVSNSTKTKLWETLFFRYPSTDLSCFKFIYEPEHPLAKQFGGPVFRVSYKDLPVCGYGDEDPKESIYAAAGTNGDLTINLPIQPEELAALDLNAACVSNEKLKLFYPNSEAEKIIYVRSIGDTATVKLAFKIRDDNMYMEHILDAETGDLLETISYVVP